MRTGTLASDWGALSLNSGSSTSVHLRREGLLLSGSVRQIELGWEGTLLIFWLDLLELYMKEASSLQQSSDLLKVLQLFSDDYLPL